MNYGDMKKRVAMRCRDPLMKELGDVEYGEVVNDAIQDLSGCGWLLSLEEDESLVLVANTYAYTVPANFAYIKELRYEDTSTSPSVYDMVIPFEEWRLGFDGSAAKITFDSRLFRYTTGDHLKVVGQKRPSELSSDATALEGGMEPFIRERAISYAARTMAMLLPERGAEQVQAMESDPGGGYIPPTIPNAEQQRAQRLMALSERAWVNSEAFLANHPQEFRVLTGSRHVPGR
jgi:hypothetical protein